MCLAIRGPDCVVFFDWEDGTFIRKIDVVPQAIYWNEAGDSLVIVCSDCFYSLRYVLFVCVVIVSFLFLVLSMICVMAKFNGTMKNFVSVSLNIQVNSLSHVLTSLPHSFPSI